MQVDTNLKGKGMNRDFYLKKCTDAIGNGMVKVITGLRRCGKSTLLDPIFKQWLLGQGIGEEQIILLTFDDSENIQYRNPIELSSYLHSKITKPDLKYFVLLDEVQFCSSVVNPYVPDGEKITFVDTLNGLLKLPNVEIYVTGSNSKMLSRDILTSFRGRDDQIHIYPLSLQEYSEGMDMDPRQAFREYLVYGGMPKLLEFSSDAEKTTYLRNLFQEIYIKDILEHDHLRDESLLEDVLDVISSTTGSLTNPNKIANTLNTEKHKRTNENTVSSYIHSLENSFLISEARRYDIRGRKYIGSPNKYYYTDLGLRNARLNFRQPDKGYMMENAVYNELLRRGYSVDVGTLYDRKGSPREIDFVVNRVDDRVYIQSAWEMEEEEKRVREMDNLKKTGDSFPKIVLESDLPRNYTDANGIRHLDVVDFLMDEHLTFSS